MRGAIKNIFILVTLLSIVTEALAADLSSECPASQNLVLYQQSEYLWYCVDLKGIKDITSLYPASKAATALLPYTEIVVGYKDKVVHFSETFWATVTIDEYNFSQTYDPQLATDLVHIMDPETNPGTEVYSDPQVVYEDKTNLDHYIKPVNMNGNYFLEFTSCQDLTCHSTVSGDSSYPDLSSARTAMNYYSTYWCNDYTQEECWWPRQNLPYWMINPPLCYPGSDYEGCWWVPVTSIPTEFCANLFRQGDVKERCGVKYINYWDGDTLHYKLYNYGKVSPLIRIDPPPPPNYSAALTQAKEYLAIAPYTASWLFQQCTINIANFSSSKAVIDPSSGEIAEFSANITSSREYTWALTIAGQEIANGTGNPVAAWNGADESGATVADGAYTVILKAVPNSGSCRAFATFDIDVVKGPEPCLEEAEIGSFVNTTSGKLTHEQEVLTLTGGSLPTQLSLFYDSFKPRSGPLAPPLIRAYGKSLNKQEDGSIIYSDQNGSKVFTPSESGYVPPPGDATTLEEFIYPDTIGSMYILTEADGTENTFSPAGKIVESIDNSGARYTFAYTKDSTIVRDPFHETTFSNLSFNSLKPIINPLGAGWAHSYDIALQDQGNGSILFKNGNSSRLYRSVGSTYVSPPRDYSKLVKNADGTIIITEKEGIAHIFDSSGRIIKRTDRNSVSMTFAYDGVNMVGVTDSVGRVTSFTYDESNKIISIMDPKGNTFEISYIDNNLTSIKNSDGGQWTYTYDDAGFLLTKTDPNGNVTSYLYDNTHRLISSTDPEQRSRSLDYAVPVAGSIKTTTLSEKDGGKWQYTYDTSAGTLMSKTDPYENITSFTYDNNKNVLGKTEPLVGGTRYAYDAEGNVESITDALLNTTSYTYNKNGQVLSAIGPDVNFVYTYDINGNLVTQTDPTGATTTYECDSRGNTTKILWANGASTNFGYNDSGLVTSITDTYGGTTSITYDLNGNVTAKTDATGKTTTFSYDSMNRLTSTVDATGNSTTYGYDKLGNRIFFTDANGNTTTYKYNYRGQVIESKDVLGNTTTFTYGATGCQSCGGVMDKLTALTDAKGQTTRWQYNLRGQIVSETDPLQKTTIYTYDTAGRINRKTDANGSSISYGHDPLGRLTGKIYPDGSSLSYTFNPAGFLATAGNSSIAYTYLYDTAGRVTGVTDSRGYALSYEYDAVGNRTKMKIQPGTADERVTLYAYDEVGRLTSITSPAGTFVFSYDSVGRRINLQYPNQVRTNYTYDAAGRFTSISHADGISVIHASDYSLDRVGNRTSIAAAELKTFVYDITYRLLSVSATSPETFNYDAAGNRQSGPGAKDEGYQFNVGNQMMQGRRLVYGYDNNGNQTTRIIPGADDKSWRMTWGYENQLVKGEKVKGEEKRTVYYTYDPFGRRIGKQVTSVKNGIQKTADWSYLYDNNEIILEHYVDETGTTTKTFYTYGPGVDEHLAMERNGSSYCFHADGLRSIVAISDANRNIVQTYEYDSHGIFKPSTNFRNGFTYTGREWDKETGLYYYRARHYDPMEGRFISRDPLGFIGGINLYSYVQNNPINYTDPTGLFWFRQSWQTPGVVGRPGTPVPPGGAVSEFIERNVPAGFTFGEMHDGFVDVATSVGIPDVLANIPSMIPMYITAMGLELLRIWGIIEQPKPTRQTIPCK